MEAFLQQRSTAYNEFGYNEQIFRIRITHFEFFSYFELITLQCIFKLKKIVVRFEASTYWPTARRHKFDWSIFGNKIWVQFLINS